MSIFENIFSTKEKPISDPIDQDSPEIISRDITETKEGQDGTLKTLEEVKEAKSRIQDLKLSEYDLLKKRRDTISSLKDLGVSDKEPNSNKRSETFNSILNPIEEEIKKVSEELSETRKDFDMPQNRKEVVKERYFRLEKLADQNAEDFLETEAGKILKKEIINMPEESRPESPEEILSWVNKIQFLNPNNPVADLSEYKKFAETNLRIQKLKEVCDEELFNLR